jgi:poly(A) polymerase
VIAALRNTDERLAQGKSVTPAFIFAALLWGAFNERRRQFEANGAAPGDAAQFAADEVIGEQVRRVAVPRRFTTVTREIWAFQPRLMKRPQKRASGLLEHPRFRAAYDFLLLRARSGEPLAEIADWWTQLQDSDPDAQERLLKNLREPPRRRARPRRRRRDT